MAKRSPNRSLSTSSGGAPPTWLWLALAAIVIVLDQFTKALIVGDFVLGESRTVTSFFNVVRAHNNGAAFSFLHDATGWQRWFFIGLGLAASAYILYLLVKHSTQRLFCFAIAMVLGGAVGNVIDRIWHGWVVDFIQVHYGTAWYFPSFNLADSAITLGAICIVIDELRRVRQG